MKYIQTFESFLNESEIDEAFNVLASEDGKENSGQLVIIDKSKKMFTGPTFRWDAKKGGIVEVYDGSHGEETRIVVKCSEKDGISAIDTAVKEFGSQNGDFNSLYKKVKDFLKKTV